MHRGVYVLTSSAITRRQRWIAAVLTAPKTYLSHGSAGACYGFFRFEKPYEVVSRPGQGGRRWHPRLVVYRSKALGGDVTKHTGIPITTAARVLVDLAPGLNDKRLGRAFRESIRLGHATAAQIDNTAGRQLHRPGASRLGRLAARYAAIPYDRTRSDAEALALEVLHDAGIPLPLVNHMVGGEEADLGWIEARVIIEIDGPQFHLFRDEDARKTAIWRKAGFDVRRISSDRVYDNPAEFIALTPGCRSRLTRARAAD